MSKSQSDSLTKKDVFRKSNFSGKIAFVLSTWFGAGLVPTAPGTSGTLAAVPLILVLGCLGKWCSALILMVVISAGIWASGRCQKLLGKHDPPEVVIDEVAGFSLTMLLLPSSWPALGLGFILFRVFDIWKPYPIKKLEKLGGGFGIVMDDLLAGVYAYGCARIILFFVVQV